MKLNGRLALKGSANDVVVKEYGPASEIGDDADLTHGIIKFDSGLKMQWDTIDVAADTTVVIDLRERYTEAHYSVMTVFSEIVTSAGNQMDSAGWVPVADPLKTLTVQNIADSTRAVGWLSIGKDHMPAVPEIDDKAISFDGNEWLKNKAAGDLLGFGNAWTIQVNMNPDFSTLNSYIVSIQNDDSNKGQIQLLHNASDSPETISVSNRNSAGGAIKAFLWEVDVVIGVNISYVITWDGTDLKLYLDGVDQGTADTLTTDSSGTMEDSVREIAFANLGTSDFGDLGANMHSASIWDVALTAAEILALDNGGVPENVDNRFWLGDYKRPHHLVHYWRMGLDSYNLGRDYGTYPVDIDEDSTGVTAVDIVDY